MCKPSASRTGSDRVETISTTEENYSTKTTLERNEEAIEKFIERLEEKVEE